MACLRWAVGLPFLAGLFVAPALAAAAPPASPTAKRPLVISRTQPHYSLSQDYLHGWDDRMLLADRATAPAPVSGPHDLNGLFTAESFVKIVRSAMAYEIDGFAMGPSRYTMHKIEAAPRYLQTAGITGFFIAPDLMGFSVEPDEYTRAVDLLIDSPAALRIADKLVLVTYRVSNNQEWKTYVDELKRTHGGRLIFFNDNFSTFLSPMHQEYFATGTVSEALRQRAKADLRRILDDFDGIYYNAPGTESSGFRDRKYDVRYNRDILTPLYTEVRSEEKYRGKYLALSAGVGHHNSGLGFRAIDEDGTKTLRRSMEIALGANPDLIVIPEWDEFNENTCLCPTVCNSFALQRIMRYYMRALKQEPCAPNPGDSTAWPNVVISYRKSLALGEPLEIEVLNIPEADTRAAYRVQVSLKDLAGRTVRTLEETEMATDRLADRTFVLASEEFADCGVLIPSVALVTPDGRRLRCEEGLHYIRLRTWNWDHKWVLQPLRDMLRPEAVSFDQEDARHDDGTITVRGAFASPEDIAFAEVLEEDDEVYSYDPRDEFRRSPDSLQLHVTFSRTGGSVNLQGKITVENSEFYLFPPSVAGMYSYNGGAAIDYAGVVDHYKRHFLLTLPKASADRAVVRFDFTGFATRIPVGKVARNGIYSEYFGNGLTLTVERYTKLFRIPLHVDRRQVEFRADVLPETAGAPFQLRVIGTSGKLYRSKPRILKPAQDVTPVSVPVLSDVRHAVVACSVPAGLVPDIVYDFTPEYGTTLHAGYSRLFWGQLGGMWDVTSGRPHFYPYGDPFMNLGPDEKRVSNPATLDKAPKWVMEDGVQCLRFNGDGSYLVLPREVIPARGAYALSFEVKPTSTRPQTLLAHRGQTNGSIVIRVENGQLGGMYYGAGETVLRPGLALPAQVWSRVDVINDLRQITFRVNGVAGTPIPYPGPGAANTCCVFGGTQSEWFEGYLKALRIRHAPELP
jgi:hypothetical protein